MGYGMMNGMGNMGWGAMALGGGMMLLWVVLLVVLVVLAFRWLGGGPQYSAGGDALEILKQRFARGEIDATEFEDRSRHLRAGP